MLISIITPTTGHSKFGLLLESINKQTYTNIEHVIVVDGVDQHGSKVDVILKDIPASATIKRYVISLPFPTGNTGYLGHKIYAGISQIINGDYVIFADEDNWYQPNHVQIYVDLITKYKYDWMFCLRNIIDYDNNYICRDDCESLGYLAPVFYEKRDNLIDTNCYCFKKEIIIKISYIWNEKVYADYRCPDRLFCKKLMMDYPNFQCTYEYTLNYRTSNRSTSVQSDFLVKGNQIIEHRYGLIPWKNKHIFLIHFDSLHTDMILDRIYSKDRPSVAFKQYALNMMDDMGDILIINGYTNYIPSNSIVLIHLCHLDQLPTYLQTRKDLIKIIYTIESPNIRHQDQWNIKLLDEFNIIISYWDKLSEIRKVNMVPFPFIHRLDMKNKNDMGLISNNTDTTNSTCIILENRSINQVYNINGVELQALDYLRELYAKEIPNIFCYGSTWKSLGSNMTCVATPSRYLDTDKTIDYMSKHTFTLIIENCNAGGYISEKIYDSWMVGSIPLYYGNTNTLVNIPENMYINLRNIAPHQIKDFINSLTGEDINRYRQNIYDNRMAILKSVSINRYNILIRDIVNNIYSQLSR